ncbi:transcriptional regulator [Marivirga lumbricoides]|uniref:Transcriptional regulator n=1 Tax=Marivirga lumbricoides TaxID=1046115 RepID=A0ABQ1MRE1_9BACT|nr:transcriptional regulator [Marivirga lumbricoides]
MVKKLDAIDLKILTLLSENAQMAYTEVAKEIKVTSGTVNLRMKKMREAGLVKGATLNIDYSQIGWGLTVFIFIHLTKSEDYQSVIASMKLIPEVVKIHHITGKYGLFVKVHAKDTQHYRSIYEEKILKIKGINYTESFISINEDLNRHILFEEE